MSNDATDYEQRLIDRIRAAGKPTNIPRPASWRVNRAISSLNRTIERFLRSAGLVQSSHRDTGAFWSDGPELLTVNALPFGSDPWLHRPLSTVVGQVPDQYQRTLVLEFQSLLLMAYGSLGDDADQLTEMIGGRLIDCAFARLFMDLSTRSQVDNETFWDSDRLTTRAFHQDILVEMMRLLVSTYEGHPVKALVTIVDPSLTPTFRWSPVGFDQLSVLAATNAARKLTEGEEVTFLFSGYGECFGLFDTSEVVAKARATAHSYVKWRLTHPGCLQGLVGSVAEGESERLLVEFSGGEWRLVDREAFRRVVEHAEQSASGANRRLLDVAEKLSNLREGALLLIVPDALSLVEAGVVDGGQLNDAGPGRVERVAAEIRERGGIPVDLDNSVSTGDHSLSTAEYLLEQYRRKAIGQIPVSVLQRLAVVDGALVASQNGELLGFGVILRGNAKDTSPQLEGARSTAAKVASRCGVAIKISSDGAISVFSNGQQIYPAPRSENAP